MMSTISTQILVSKYHSQIKETTNPYRNGCFYTRIGKVYDEKLEHVVVQESKESLKSDGNTQKRHMSQGEVAPHGHVQDI